MKLKKDVGSNIYYWYYFFKFKKSYNIKFSSMVTYLSLFVEVTDLKLLFKRVPETETNNIFFSVNNDTHVTQ